MNKEEFISAIESYLPERSAEAVASWILDKPLKLKIKNNRKTKLGDFRAKRTSEQKHTITINAGLNPYEFLITLVHEFAHLVVYEEFGRMVRPHGIEWQNAYRTLMVQYFELDVFPKSLTIVLLKHLRNPKASSHGDLNMVRELARYDKHSESEDVYLEELQHGESFIINGRVFVKGEKRRTRFMCTELNSRRKFTVSALAKVLRYE